MSDLDLNQFHHSTADWRSIIKKNKRRSYWVITAFVFIYLTVGFLFDLVINSQQYPKLPIYEIFGLLITLKIPPVATIITTAIALFSLLITFVFHRNLVLLGTEYKELKPGQLTDIKEQQLYNVVEEMKVAAGMQFMPKVFIIDADYMNAFASGYSEKSALVAITRGLLEKLTRDELTAVMAHELSHIRHMDIKLTLLASVLANFIVMLVDLLFWFFIGGRRSSDRDGGGNIVLALILIALRFVLPIITVMLMFYLSRKREYMADAGCVELMRTNEPLANALLKIQQDHQEHKSTYTRKYKSSKHENIRQQFYIFDPVQAGIKPSIGLSEVFSTHPSIINRLKALGFTSKD